MHFSPEVFRFLRQLRANNNREWFLANKERYETKVRDPILRFIADAAPGLAKISKAIVADPRPSGGSLFRIHRDTRFSRDKSPYKTHLGAQFFHQSAKKSPSVPGFYLHVAPGESFIASGIWHPDPAALAKLREAIVDGAKEWKALRKSKLPIEGGSLKRPPRGVPCEHPEMEYLKHTDFVSSVKVTDQDMCSPDFLKAFLGECKRMTPMVRFVTSALDLEF